MACSRSSSRLPSPEIAVTDSARTLVQNEHKQFEDVVDSLHDKGDTQEALMAALKARIREVRGEK